MTRIDRSRISRIETGSSWPRDWEIEALAKAFDLQFTDVCQLAREACQATRDAERNDSEPQEVTA